MLGRPESRPTVLRVALNNNNEARSVGASEFVCQKA